MTAPVKGKPNVLYVEGGVTARARLRGLPRARARAREHRRRGARPARLAVARPRSSRSTIWCWSPTCPRTSWAPAQMAALDSYVRDLGGGLIMAGGEDSFGSGGYQGTRMEKIMPVRFDSEKTARAARHRARRWSIDRSGSMQGPRSRRPRSRRGSPPRCSRRPISSAWSRSTARRPGIRAAAARREPHAHLRRDHRAPAVRRRHQHLPGLREAFEVLQGHQRQGQARHRAVRRRGALRRHRRSRARRCAARASRSRRSASAAPIATCFEPHRRQRRRPPLHDRGHRRVAAHLHEGDHRGAEVGSWSRITVKVARRQARRDDRGHRRRERAARCAATSRPSPSRPAR